MIGCIKAISPCVKSASAKLFLDLHTVLAPSGEERRTSASLLNPDFYETQPQKPHNKLKKAQMTLREKRLRPELKLGGESDNPTSKGIL